MTTTALPLEATSELDEPRRIVLRVQNAEALFVGQVERGITKLDPVEDVSEASESPELDAFRQWRMLAD